MPLDSVGEAVRTGAISFAFFDAPYWERFGGLTATTFRELVADTGLAEEILATMRESMGYARPRPDDLVREDELDVVPLLRALIGMGVDPEALEQQVRVWGDSVRRIADADATFYRGQVQAPLLSSGLSWSDVLQASTAASEAMVPLLDPALLSLYHARSEHSWMANAVEAVEVTLEQAGLHRSVSRPPAMCFLDLSGYTRLTEERGDEAAADMATTLGKLVQRGAHDVGGRPVKSLGDGVMVHFPEPAGAVRFALDMVERIPAAGLPATHGGIDAGPLVFQDGDYFGRTVNIAARIAAYAGAGQVLVSDSVVQAAGDDPNIGFAVIGEIELKGVPRPVLLHEARRGG